MYFSIFNVESEINFSRSEPETFYVYNPEKNIISRLFGIFGPSRPKCTLNFDSTGQKNPK